MSVKEFGVEFLHEKAFRDLGYRIMWDKLDTRLDRFAINQMVNIDAF